MLHYSKSPQSVNLGSRRASSTSVPLWLEYIAPDFAQANTNTIAGAKKLIEAKKALRRSKGSFRQLVAGLGMDLDKAERLMVIARHSVLSDSAHARDLPLSWMTQFTLAKIPADVLAQLIADGTVHPLLERKEAERLVKKVRRQNSANESGGEAHTESRSGSDDGGDRDDPHDPGEDDHEEPVEAQSAVGETCIDSPSARRKPMAPRPVKSPTSAAVAEEQWAVGAFLNGIADSPDEIKRKWARLEELELVAQQREIENLGLRSEIEDLRGALDEGNKKIAKLSGECVALRAEADELRAALDRMMAPTNGNATTNMMAAE